MDGKELLSIIATLATIAVGLVAVLDHMEDEGMIEAPEVKHPPSFPSNDKIIVQARAVINDSGQIYIITWNNDVLKMNGSIEVV